MGLDIYMHEVEAEDQEPEWPSMTPEIFPEMYDAEGEFIGWDKAPPGVRERQDARLNAHRLARDLYEAPFKSRLHPESYSTRRYLRSSYNESGFNSNAHRMIGKDLYWIFFGEPEGHVNSGALQSAPGYVPWVEEDDPDEEREREYGWFPPREHLVECLERAKQVVEELRGESLNVATFDMNALRSRPTYSDADALQLVKKEIIRDRERKAQMEAEGRKDIFGSSGYSNSEGDFYPSGWNLKVVGVIMGQGVLGSRAAHIVYEMPEGENHTLQTAEVVVEFIEEAIDILDRGHTVRIIWSG